MAYPDKKPALAVMIGSREPKHEEGEFKAPEGFDMEGKEPGDTVEAVVELEIKPDGMLCVRKLNGIDIGDYSDNKDEKEPEDQGDSFTGAVMGGEAPEQEGA